MILTGQCFKTPDLHEEAWINMVKKYSKGTLKEEDILVNLHGRTNKEILTYFISDSLTDEEIEKLSFEKEAFYRELCLKNPKNLKLTEGLVDVLNQLKEKQIPITIATATVKENIEFYFDVFELHKWFNFE